MDWERKDYLKPKDDETYQRREVCWYGHIFRRYPDAVTARKHSRWHSNFDPIVKIWRRKKIGQNAFSLKIGMSSGFFGEVKRGTRLPNAASFNTIAARLGMPVETLIGRKQK